jgi:PHD/YefM family antitoxin component YafN of YafNO toxin-antitoxin module
MLTSLYTSLYTLDMKVTALEIRNAFGKVLKKLQCSNEPIIIEKGRKPVAVLISMQMFEQRFIDKLEAEKRHRIVQLFRDNAVEPAEDPIKVLRELRYGKDS